jgi:hypothetical protein
MGYQEVAKIEGSSRLRERVVAAVAQEGAVDPEAWWRDNSWKVASAPTWDQKWAAGEQYDLGNDVGGRTDVFTDGDILAVVQSIGVT